MKNSWINTGRFDAVFFTALFILCLVLSYIILFPGGRSKPGSNVIKSDQAMYYVYLPATFIYGFDIKKFPDSIDKKCEGFVFNTRLNKLETKMTYGIALLCSPFFFVAHAIAGLFNLQPDGFSLFYQELMIIPACFYLILGLFFLKRFLRNYFPNLISYLTILLIFAGTNLFYYSLNRGLMSHVYSFCLFAVYLFLLKRFLDSENKRYRDFLLIAFVLSIAILVRSTNIFMLACFVFLDAGSFRETRKRLVFYLHPKYWLAFILICLMVFFPQMLYWKYLSGSWFYYSYHNEGFSNWKHPMMIESWFSPLNGLFLYNPLVLFFIAGIVIMIIKRKPNGIFTGLFFLLISYVFSSWWCWYYGGSYGARVFVEFFTLLAIPLGCFLESLKKLRNLYLRSLVVFFLLSFSYYNIRFTWNYGWYHNAVWGWDDFRQLTDYAGISRCPRNTYTFIDDFEFDYPFVKDRPDNTCPHSPTRAILCRGNEFFCYYSWKLNGILDKPVKNTTASIWINPLKPGSTGAYFVCSIEDTNHYSHIYKSLKVDDFIVKPGNWTKVQGSFNVPEWIDPGYSIVFYIWNPRNNRFYLDDFSVRFE